MSKSKKCRKKIIVSRSFISFSILLVVFFCGVLFVNYVLLPKIELKDGNKIVINYKEKYSEKGFSASFFGKNITNDVKVRGDVDTGKLGTYEVTYDVDKGFFKRHVVREVVVADMEKPRFEVDKGDIYVCPGSEFKPDNIKAIDNYDGDLTPKVKNEVFKDKVVYSVVDSSGNRRELTKKIFYKDIAKPEIKLFGPEVVSVCLNEDYREPGYEVVDNCDKDIKAEVLGSVNKSSAGEYELTYKAVDKSGNEASLKRKVVVSGGDAPGIVYLTFDDGPNDGTTNVILDILKEEGVEATFFVTGYGPDELIKREHDEGHTVALHTNVHDYARVYASDDAYYSDLKAIHDRVYNITGVDSRTVRFPGGSSNTVSRKYSAGIMSRLTQGVLNKGYRYYDWNVSSGDAGGTTDPNQVYLNVTSGLRKDRVNNVLMHDTKPHTRDALRNIIRYCKENGYQIKKISSCSTMTTQRVNN